MREEADIFSDLELLCSSPGYAHVIAFFCFKDTFIGYENIINPEDLARLCSHERLIRTEISTLIGLMLKNEIDFTLPSPEKMQDYINKTTSLLKELHDSLVTPLLAKTNSNESRLYDNGLDLREPIFYGAESAYNFQYLEFAALKYTKDNNRLVQNKGFSIEDAKNIISSINDVQNNKAKINNDELMKKNPEYWTMLPAFIFTLDEIVLEAKVDEKIVYNVIKAFSHSREICNQDFDTLNDFNIINAYPIIELNDNKYLLLQQYSLAEAFYETPFYWLNNDRTYYDFAARNRGAFTETICKEKLEIIFGKNRVWSNIDIIDPNKNKAGEIDVLVIFADRVIILQAKSKRLTIEAKKGNDKVIKDDFRKSIQDSYD